MFSSSRALGWSNSGLLGERVRPPKPHSPRPAPPRPGGRPRRPGGGAGAPDGLGQLGQQPLRRRQVDAGVGDALAVLQPLGVPRSRSCRPATRLLSTITPRIACSPPAICAGQVVRRRRSGAGGSSGCCRARRRRRPPPAGRAPASCRLVVGDVGGGVVRAVLVAAQDDVGGVVAGGRQLGAHPVVVDAEELVRCPGGEHRRMAASMLPSGEFLKPTTEEKPDTRSRAVWSVTLRAPTPL